MSHVLPDPWAPQPAAAGDTAAPGYLPPAEAAGQDRYSEGRLRPIRGLGTLAAALLGVQALLGLASAAVSAWGVLTWSRLSSAPAGLRLGPEAAASTLLRLAAPLTLATALAFLSWLYVAAANAERAGARLRRSPGWAVGSWFVPVLNLWRPKQVLDDVWRASSPGVPRGADLRQVPTSLLVTAWWTCYLLAGTLSAVGAARATGTLAARTLTSVGSGSTAAVVVDTARLHESVALWNLWSAVFLVLAAGLGGALVLRLTAWQQDWHLPQD